MKETVVVATLVAGIAIVLVAALVLLQASNIAGTTMSLTPQSEAKTLLERLGVPDGAGDISAISVEGPDGPMPAIASRSFVYNGDADALRRFYRAQCRAAEFSRPDDDTLRVEPATLCIARQPGEVTRFLLYTDCTPAGCRVIAEAGFLTM